MIMIYTVDELAAWIESIYTALMNGSGCGSTEELCNLVNLLVKVDPQHPLVRDDHSKEKYPSTIYYRMVDPGNFCQCRYEEAPIPPPTEKIEFVKWAFGGGKNGTFEGWGLFNTKGNPKILVLDK